MSSGSKGDRTEDLASLFLPETLQNLQQNSNTNLNSTTNTNTTSTSPNKANDDPNGIDINFNNSLGTNNQQQQQQDKSGERSDLSKNEMLSNDNDSINLPISTSYQDFLNSNNFINKPINDEPEQPFSHSSHYAQYMQFDPSNMNMIQHYSNFHNPIYQQLYSQSIPGQQQSQQQLQQQPLQQSQQQQQQQQLLQPQFNPDGNNLLLHSPSPFPQQMNYNQRNYEDYESEWLNSQSQIPYQFDQQQLHLQPQQSQPPLQSQQQQIQQLQYRQQQQQQQQIQQRQQQQQQQQHQFQQLQQNTQHNSNSKRSQSPQLQEDIKKKKPKGRKRDSKQIFDFQIDYKPTKMKKLLDFTPSGITSINDYKIIDNNNNEINVDFNGFFNGRFFTNDTDNNNYIFTKNELQKNNKILKYNNHENHPQIEDPKVVSCYRRNYIQILLNMKLNGINKDFKLLKLQTSEYGYTTTRVIKYFKIEILATTNISNSKNVPIIIRNEPKDVEKEKDKENNKKINYYESKEDIIQPQAIGSQEHIIVINNESESIIKNNEMDKYFIIKKLQFKNATPNNGNLTFQNYYHLKIKLSCIVADIYYDDYIDDIDPTEINKNGSTSNNNGNNTNEFLLTELISEPIIVRGRNPSFYAERKDLLIKCRQFNSKKSFQLAAESNLKDDDNHNNGFEENENDHQDHDHNDHESGYDNDNDNEHDNNDNNNDHDQDMDSGLAENDSNDEGSPYTTKTNNDKQNDYGMSYNNFNSSRNKSFNNNNEINQNSPIDDSINKKKSIIDLNSKIFENDTSGNLNPTNLSSSSSYSINQNHTNPTSTTLSSIDLNSIDGYKYFPISSHYYLPPVNVVYFPHRAHHPIEKDEFENNNNNLESNLIERKSSNVYFK
ncbi:uncharacterized protein KGF55_000123 [Candida pseudojiufengensis]|uniref:uncharacterized protein n=1 Tax=Candida pseudojiufengensis TaxID=497109 RepID=UPI0022245085|nr:uncharacterized protein KGF55_000123 [Candida pseudojiufengensis]KAI5966714.1 hypothetical protein KGF55_000123 [Candida pseudojiufengensis]